MAIEHGPSLGGSTRADGFDSRTVHEGRPAPAAAKWTKTAIKSLCAHLDTFWLSERGPLDLRSHDKAAANVRAVLANPSHRKDVVLAGIRAGRVRCQERYRQDCETIGNQLVRFTAYGQPDELVERFTKLAREEDAADKWLEKLLHRVLDEGVPPEVAAYDPTGPR